MLGSRSLPDLCEVGVAAAQGVQARKSWWLRRVARCEVLARYLDPLFSSAGYPRGITLAEHWVDSFVTDSTASLLSDEVLRLHLDSGRGGRFQAEAELRRKVPPYRLINLGLRWVAWVLSQPWGWVSRRLPP